jgi:type III secretory pathway component EscV
MIGLIIDRRATSDETMPLDVSCLISEKVGREGIPSVVISDNAVEENTVVIRMAHGKTSDLSLESAKAIIERLAPSWSLQDAQVIYVAADSSAINDANETDATIIRVGEENDSEADQTIAHVSEILDVVASEYTASLLEVRYLLMRLAWNAHPYIAVVDATSP